MTAATACPLCGGPMPPLGFGPPGGAYSGAMPMGMERSDKHKFGQCAACEGVVMTDVDGNVIAVADRDGTTRFL